MKGFPILQSSFFKEFYKTVKSGDISGAHDFPDFRAGLRELVLNEKIVESSRKGCWIKIK